MRHPEVQEPLLPAAAGAAAPRDTRQVADAPRDTFWPCVANLSKVIIGAGMMAIPQAFCRIGSVAGTSMLVLVGLMTYTTLVFLLRGSAATGAATYSQLTQQLCGTPVMKVLQVAVLSFCFGFGVVYLVIIRDILLGSPPECNGLLCELFGLPTSSMLCDGRLVLVMLALLVCCPLLLLRSMDRLAVLNVVGVSAIAMLALTALGLAAKGLAQGSAHPIPLWPQWDQLGRSRAEQLQALTAVMPVMIACYVAHQSLHPLMPLLQPFSDKRMRGVIAAALLIAFGVFGSLAVGSSLAFGPALEVNVLNNFSVTGLQPLTGLVLARLLSFAIRGGYLLSLLASLLLYMHPLRACLAEMIWSGTTPTSQPSDMLPTEQAHGNSTGVLHQGSNNGVPQASSSESKAGAMHHQQQQQQQKVRGSAFATPAAQAGPAAAAAAAAVPSRLSSVDAASSGGGSGGSASSGSRQLTTFDSFDNPRTGSWSGVKYLPGLSPHGPQQQLKQQQQQGRQQQQQQQQGRGPRTGGSGGSNASSHVTPSIEHGQQHVQIAVAAAGLEQQGNVRSYVRDGVQIHVSVAGSRLGIPSLAPHQRQDGRQQAAGANSTYAAGGSGSSGSSSSSGVVSWREGEQRWYYRLTYGLLAAMVLVAIAVPNIWTALSAIGDLASTLQAFVVPGLIGIILKRHTKLTGGTSVQMRLQHAASGVVGGVAVFLGLALFANGIYQRL